MKFKDKVTGVFYCLNVVMMVVFLILSLATYFPVRELVWDAVTAADAFNVPFGDLLFGIVFGLALTMLFVVFWAFFPIDIQLKEKYAFIIFSVITFVIAVASFVSVAFLSAIFFGSSFALGLLVFPTIFIKKIYSPD